jgi:hypothetical protein
LPFIRVLCTSFCLFQPFILRRQTTPCGTLSR